MQVHVKPPRDNARVLVPAGPRRVIDLSSIEFDDADPFHDHATHRHRWLLTTSLASLSVGVMVSGILFMTFGQGGFEGPAVASRQAANLWQRSAAALKADRVFGFTPKLDRAALARLVREEPYKRVSAAVVPGDTSSRQNLRKSGLIGSLAPIYASTGSPEITGSISREPAPAKPTVLASRGAADSGGNIAALPGLVRETITLTRGDTLFSRLTKQGADNSSAQRLISELESLFPTRYLLDGQKIRIAYQTGKDAVGRPIKRPVRLAIAIDPKREIVVEETKDGRYKGYDTWVRTARAEHPTGKVRARARIRKSLYVAAKKQGIPERLIVEMMRIHAYDVDFQREIRRGDTFEVFYALPDGTKSKSRRSKILYSSLTIAGKTKGYYRFTSPDDSITEYFDKDGRSATKFLIRTPIKFRRISSGFGMRRHPVLGYSRMHAGVDFAAPYGTPVKAAGSGVIEKIGRVGGYGNYIRVRHVNGFKTAYAHMKGFASGLKVGSRVRQAQVIGYVGSTGRSTGPHLHYEIRINNKPVNPMRVKLPTGRKLKGRALRAFFKEKKRIDDLRRRAPVATQVADASK